MPLSEQHRAKLDSIVQQMEQNAEPEESIRAVVEDYKGKYGAYGEQAQSQSSTPAPQAPSKPGAIQSFAEHFGPTAAFAHPGDLARDVGNYLGGVTPGELGAAFLTPKVPIQLAKDAYNASSSIAEDQFNKMYEAYEGGDTLAAAARAALGIIGSFPGTSGAVAAGEKLADPETRAGGVGAALGELANVALPFLAKPTARVAQAAQNKVADIGTGQRALAKKIYAEGLHPKLRFEGLADEVAQGGIERGLYGSLESLEEAAAAMRAQHGPEIARIIQESQADPLRRTEIPIRSEAAGPLQKFGASETFGPREQGFRDLAGAAAAELERLPESLPADQAWRMIGVKRDPVVRSGAFLPGVDPRLGAAMEAQGISGEAVARSLKQQIPEVARDMKEYSFASKLRDVLEHRKATPETSLNPFKADSTLKLLDPYRIVQAIRNSTRWKTGSAVLRDRIGKLLEQGRYQEAAQAAEIPGLKLPQEQAPDLEAFSSPPSPELPQAPSAAPQIWGDEVPPGFDIPEAQAQRLMSEFAEVGFEPDTIPLEGLADPDLARLAAADRKAVEIVMRTIQNPTYQRLPIQAGNVPSKTRADVLRNIFERYRSQGGF